MARYRLLIKPSAVKEIEDLPRKDRTRVVRKIQELPRDPRPHACEKLSNQDQYRIRQGNYRVVYSVDDAEGLVVIVKIGHRKEVYR